LIGTETFLVNFGWNLELTEEGSAIELGEYLYLITDENSLQFTLEIWFKGGFVADFINCAS